MKIKHVGVYSLLICIAGLASYPLRPSTRPNYNYAKDGYVVVIQNNQSIHYQVSQQLNPSGLSSKGLNANGTIRYGMVPPSARRPKNTLKKITTDIQYATGQHKGSDFQSVGRIYINPDIADENGQTRLELFVDTNGARVVCQTIDMNKAPIGTQAKKEAILFEDSITLRSPEGDPRKSLSRHDNPAYDPMLIADGTPWTVNLAISSIGYGYFSEFAIRVGKANRRWKLDRPEIDSAFSSAYLNALYPHLVQPTIEPISPVKAIVPVFDQSPQESEQQLPVQSVAQSTDTSGEQMSEVSNDESLLPQYTGMNEVVIVQDQPVDQLHLEVLDANGRSKKDPLRLAEQLVRMPKGQYALLQILSYLFQCENITALSIFTKKYDTALQKIFSDLAAQKTPQASAILSAALPIFKDVYRYAERTDAQQLITSIEAMVNNAVASTQMQILPQ